MTQEELYRYIDSFNREKGTYTKEEILLICFKHKYELSHTEKNWNRLSLKLGINRSGEGLRKWFSRQISSNIAFINLLSKEKSSKDDILLNANETAATTPSHMTISALPVSDILNDKEAEKFKEMYLQQTKTKDLLNSYRRLLRDEARIESLKETIQDTVKLLPDLPLINFKNNFEFNSITTPNEGVLLFSDLHIGAECDNYCNKYNLDVAKERLNKLAHNVIECCKETKVSILNILNLGDLIQGVIHVTSRIEQQIDVIQQVIIAAELLSEFLNKIQEAAPTIVYRSCVDNHSRLVADKTQHIEKENFAKIIDWYTKERLKNTSIKFVDDNIDDGLGYFSLSTGEKCMFAHGHNDCVDKSLQNFVGATKQFVNYGFFGHFHSEKMKSFQNYRVFINGSIIGTDSYAFSKRLFNEPSQKLIIFKPNNLIYDISIKLS